MIKNYLIGSLVITLIVISALWRSDHSSQKANLLVHIAVIEAMQADLLKCQSI